MDARGNQKRAESENFPFRRFIRRQVAKDDPCSFKNGSLGNPLMDLEGFVEDNSALLSLHPWVFKKESFHEGISIGVDKSEGSVRSRRLQRFSMKPANFMGNYFTPFNQHAGIEDYVINSPPNSPARTLRPFVVTHGNRIISKSGFECFGIQHESELHIEADGVDLGAKGALLAVPTLPDPRKTRRKSGELQNKRVEASNLQKFEGPKDDRMLPVYVGISIGMISAFLLKRTEVDKLSKKLKQTEDLVQDLHEELEMKDSLAVKELEMKSQNLTPHSIPPNDSDCLYLNQTGEKSEYLSKIEAELEEELERLEQNMNACKIEQRMSDLNELDPDLIANVVRGELRADNLTVKIPESEANSSNDTYNNTTSTTHTYNANYSVSPKVLSLRLHQVIQARLEARIEELEKELQLTRNQLPVERAFSNSEMGFSSNQESPQVLVHPFCLELSGEALDAYDEVYKEFMQVEGKEKSPAADIDEYRSNSSRLSLPLENILWSRESNEMVKFDEENDGSGSASDEEGKILIQKLVEKKKGSPALINAQKLFLLMDEGRKFQ